MFTSWLMRAAQSIHMLVLHDGEQDAGQGLVEYALILIFVAVVVVAILAVLSPGINNAYANIISTL